jgi:tetratricopeptide (TPR) repeat protein
MPSAAKLAGSVAGFLAEGDIHAKRGDWSRACHSYGKVLRVDPEHKLALLGRTRCYISLGQPELGIVDVDRILARDRDSYKAIFLKGESLFSAGKFEFALIQYHRGHKLRGDLDDFRLGIQKCHEAIDLALSVTRRPRRQGAPSRLSQTAPAGGSGEGAAAPGGERLGSPGHARNDPHNNTTGGLNATSRSLRSRGGAGGGGGGGGRNQVLGELTADRKFLEELLADESRSKKDDKISSIASDGLKYLDTRTEFWRQQNPGHAAGGGATGGGGGGGGGPPSSRGASRAGSRGASRAPPLGSHGHDGGAQRESLSRGYQADRGAARTTRTPKTIAKQRYLENTRFAMQKLEAINVEMEKEDWTSALKMQKSFLSRLNTIELADKGRILGTLYDMMGTTYFNLDKLNLAIIHFRKDLDIAVKEKFKDAFLRALGNLAIVYHRQSEFDQAAVMWEKKLIALDDANEEAELCESIARCYFSSQKYELAIEYGDRGVQAAQARGQVDIEMSTTFIVGHAHFNLAQYDKAVECYEAYLELARQQKDDVARADALSALASAYLQVGEIAKSVALQQEAISISSSLQKPPPDVKEQNRPPAGQQQQQQQQAVEAH